MYSIKLSNLLSIAALTMGTILLFSFGCLANGGDEIKSGQPSSMKASSQFVYTYLEATRKDCVTGDSHIFSPIIMVERQTWEKQKYALVAKFQDALLKAYPRSVFSVNLNMIQGQFATVEDARHHKTANVDYKSTLFGNVHALVLK